MIATLWCPSLNPLESPFPFVSIAYVLALLVVDYCGPLFSLSPEARLKAIVFCMPLATVFTLLFVSAANVQMLVLLGLNKYRTFPNLSDYLANYVALCFACLILTRAFKSSSLWIRAVAKAEFIVFLAAICAELIEALDY